MNGGLDDDDEEEEEEEDNGGGGGGGGSSSWWCVHVRPVHGEACLTHPPLVPQIYMCVSVSIGSGNGLLHIPHQAII